MTISYAEACMDPNLFGPWFSAPSWSTWRVIDKALFGEPLSTSELKVWKKLTGRKRSPTEPATECWLAFGRRSGKDVKAASLVVYLSTIGAERYGYRQRLTRGERGVVQLLAVDRDQSKVCMGYVRDMFDRPLLRALVRRETATSIELTNQLSVEITTNDKRRVRGRTVVAAVLDEVAHWRSDDDSVNPAEEVYAALKPAMATIPNALLIGISSPYARRGLLWSKFEKHYGKKGNVLCMRAPTWLMNPTLPRDSGFIAEQFENDPAWASGEYGAEWRTDVEQFLSREALDAVISRGVRERAPLPDTKYFGFVDPSGGSSDSMTLAIAHNEDRVILDAVREVRPPFSPESVVDEFVKLLRSYRVASIRGDRYAGLWPSDQFAKRGVQYIPAGKNKSDLYLSALPLINSASVDLLDNTKLTAQFLALERRTARGGKDSIDHPRGARDDVANCVAGVLELTHGAMRHHQCGEAPIYIDGSKHIGDGRVAVIGGY